MRCEGCRQPMQTYRVTCWACGEERWPTLAVRPATYVCVRCTSVGATIVVKRRETATRRAKARQAGSERTDEA